VKQSTGICASVSITASNFADVGGNTAYSTKNLFKNKVVECTFSDGVILYCSSGAAIYNGLSFRDLSVEILARVRVDVYLLFKCRVT
jgi:hypothetical protein